MTDTKNKADITTIIVICLSTCFSCLFIYCLIDWGGTSTIANFTKSVLTSIFATLIGLISFYYIFEIRGINPDKQNSERIRNLLRKVERLESLIDNLNESTTKNILVNKDLINTNNDLFNSLDQLSLKSKNLVKHLENSTVFTRKLNHFMVDSLLSRANPLDMGYSIKSERLALNSYIDFWTFLVKQQRDIYNLKLNNPNVENIIARILHSNSIHIWTNENEKYKDFTSEILSLSREFTILGGIAVRIFIGDSKDPNSNYIKAMERMDKVGVEVKYLSKSEIGFKPGFDFLYLYDQKITLQWKSDNYGDGLDECIFLDYSHHLAKKWWVDFFYILEEKGGEHRIQKIPKSRQFDIRKNIN